MWNRQNGEFGNEKSIKTISSACKQNSGWPSPFSLTLSLSAVWTVCSVDRYFTVSILVVFLKLWLRGWWLPLALFNSLTFVSPRISAEQRTCPGGWIKHVKKVDCSRIWMVLFSDAVFIDDTGFLYNQSILMAWRGLYVWNEIKSDFFGNYIFIS